MHSLDRGQATLSVPEAQAAPVVIPFRGHIPGLVLLVVHPCELAAPGIQLPSLLQAPIVTYLLPPSAPVAFSGHPAVASCIKDPLQSAGTSWARHQPFVRVRACSKAETSLGSTGCSANMPESRQAPSCSMFTWQCVGSPSCTVLLATRLIHELRHPAVACSPARTRDPAS